MKIRNLNEETLEQSLTKEEEEKVERYADVLNAEDRIASFDGPYGEVEEALDDALESARDAEMMGTVSSDNVLLIGRAGTGKTERVKHWCRQRGIKPFFADVQSMDPTDLAGIIARSDENPKFSSRLGNTEFHKLDEPDSVLFLDEINRATPEVLGSLLTLVQNHLIVDPTAPGNKRRLKGMLFTIAAMNPYNPAYKTGKLDMAMLSRFGQIEVEAKNEFQAEFFKGYFEKALKDLESQKNNPRYAKLKQKLTGQAAIAQTLMASPDFRFDNDDDEYDASDAQKASLNPRSLTAAIQSCDGTKESFLKKFMQKCNPTKREMVEDILEGYIDVDDEANAALAYGDEDPFAQKKKAEKSAWDELTSKNIF